MKKFLLLFYTTLILFSCKTASADHVMGTDLQWKSLGNDTFKVIVKFYRDCRGITKSPTLKLTFASDSCGYSINSLVNCNRISLLDITPTCNLNKPCDPSNTMRPNIPYGIEEHRFEGKIYLGGNYANCCWYKFIFTECCRGGPINTGHSWANYSNEMWLNRCISPANNSPEFKNPPLLIQPVGIDVLYNNGVVDIDGDSLVYKKALPIGANYTSPWSVNYPLTCFGGNLATPNPNVTPAVGYSLDAFSGDIVFRPMIQQETTLKIMVEEWRKINGVYKIIGIVSRDVQFIVLSNVSNKPDLSGPYTYDVCLGQQFCFNINTSSFDTIDSTRIFLNHGLPGSTWLDNNDSVKNATGKFCWLPTDSSLVDTPFYIRVIASNNHCPMPVTASKSYMIKVRVPSKDTRKYTKINCTSWEFKATPIGTIPSVTYTWYIPKRIGMGTPDSIYNHSNPTQFQFLQSGTYLIKNSISDTCGTTTYIDTLVVDSNLPLTIANPIKTNLCLGDAILLTCDSANNYQWYDDGVVVHFAVSKTYLATKAGKYSVKSTNSGCLSISNTITITESSKPILTKTAKVCEGENVIYKVLGDSSATYQWYRNGIAVSGANKDSLITVIGGFYFCRITQTNCILESITDTLTFFPFPLKPIISRIGNTLISSSGFTYQWYLNNVLLAGANDSFYFNTTPGSYKVKITGANGCSIFSDPFTFVGLEFNEFKTKINISPNPFKNELYIETHDLRKGTFLSINDATGKLIMKLEINSNGRTKINTASLIPGVYILVINDSERRAMFKIEKQ